MPLKRGRRRISTPRGAGRAHRLPRIRGNATVSVSRRAPRRPCVAPAEHPPIARQELHVRRSARRRAEPIVVPRPLGVKVHHDDHVRIRRHAARTTTPRCARSLQSIRRRRRSTRRAPERRSARDRRGDGGALPEPRQARDVPDLGQVPRQAHVVDSSSCGASSVPQKDERLPRARHLVGQERRRKVASFARRRRHLLQERRRFPVDTTSVWTAIHEALAQLVEHRANVSSGW